MEFRIAFMSDPTNYFQPNELIENLKVQSIRSGTITLLSQGARFSLQLLSTFVLARLLTPKDFGLVAMVTAVTGFISLFKDLGLSSALIQKDRITQEQVSTLFWINLAISLLLMTLTMALAPLVAWFYKEPCLSGVMMVSAVAFLLAGSTVQHQALLRRQMQFKALAIVDIIACMTGVGIGIISAVFGARYWALVFMLLGIAFATTVGSWIACTWKPGFPVRNSGVRSMLVFGGHLTGFNMVNFFARNLDAILIGRVWGAQPLGYYSRAYSLLMLPLQQITEPMSAVAVAALSRLQDDPERLRKFYLQGISLVTLVTMPLIAFLTVRSKDIILLVFGPQWVPAAGIFAVLGISALIQPIYNSSGWLFISTGNTRRLFRWGLPNSLVICLSFLVGIKFGPTGVAICYTIVTYLILAPCIWYAGKPVGLTFHAVLGVNIRYFLAALGSGGVCLLFSSCISLPPILLFSLFLYFSLFCFSYVSLLILLYRGMEPFRNLRGIYRQAFMKPA
jgi:PST family polysaccharide transporter